MARKCNIMYMQTFTLDRYGMVYHMVTLKDIAALCNVSVATVSRALNGQTDKNNPTALRICKMAQEMGYFPNAAARALKTNRSYNIGILYEDEIHHEYFSMMIDTMKLAAEAKGYDITFLSKTNTTNYYDRAKYRCMDGVILLQASFVSPAVVHLVQSDLPCVAVDYEYDCCPCVLGDNQNSIAQLIHLAYQKGHRKIAFVHGQSDGYVTEQRLAGFYKACASLGLIVPEYYVIEAAYHDPAAAALATHRLLTTEDAPTCILYPDDYSCLGAYTELEKMERSIPKDVSIIGYDGIMLSAVLRPQLTTYRQDVQRMGKEAVHLLTKAIETPETSANEHVIIPGVVQQGGTLIDITQ